MKDVLNEKQYKFLKYTLCALFVIAFLFFLSEFNINAAPKEEKNPKELLRVEQLDASYNDLASVLNTTSSFMLGMSIISGVGIMIIHFIRLGKSGSNPQERAKVIQDMLVTGFCLALLGSINLVVFFVTMNLRV